MYPDPSLEEAGNSRFLHRSIMWFPKGTALVPLNTTLQICAFWANEQGIGNITEARKK